MMHLITYLFLCLLTYIFICFSLFFLPSFLRQGKTVSRTHSAGKWWEGTSVPCPSRELSCLPSQSSSSISSSANQGKSDWKQLLFQSGLTQNAGLKKVSVHLKVTLHCVVMFLTVALLVHVFNKVVCFHPVFVSVRQTVPSYSPPFKLEMYFKFISYKTSVALWICLANTTRLSLIFLPECLLTPKARLPWKLMPVASTIYENCRDCFTELKLWPR